MTHSRGSRATAIFRAAFSAAFSCSIGIVQAQAVDPSDAAIWSTMPTSNLPSRLPIGADSRGVDWSVRALASDFEAADAVPVRGLSGNWDHYTPRSGHNAALQSARAELAVSRGFWELAVVGRADILITGPRSTWDAVRTYYHKDTPADGASFDVRARDNGIIWTGLRGAHTWTLRPGTDNGLQLTGALTVLSVRRVQETDVTGRIGYTNAGGYAFQVDAQRQDSQKHFGGYGLQDTTGDGYSADLGVMWRPSASSFFNVSAVDLFSRARINAVSTQQATLSTSTHSIDSRGYLSYQPLVVGRYLSAKVDTTLGRKWSAAAGTELVWSGYRFTAGGRFERIGEVNLPALWTTLPLISGVSAQVDAELRFRSLGIGLVSRYASLMLRSRSVHVGESKVIGWQASAFWPL